MPGSSALSEVQPTRLGNVSPTREECRWTAVEAAAVSWSPVPCLSPGVCAEAVVAGVSLKVRGCDSCAKSSGGRWPAAAGAADLGAEAAGPSVRPADAALLEDVESLVAEVPLAAAPPLAAARSIRASRRVLGATGRGVGAFCSVVEESVPEEGVEGVESSSLAVDSPRNRGREDALRRRPAAPDWGSFPVGPCLSGGISGKLLTPQRSQLTGCSVRLTTSR